MTTLASSLWDNMGWALSGLGITLSVTTFFLVRWILSGLSDERPQTAALVEAPSRPHHRHSTPNLEHPPTAHVSSCQLSNTTLTIIGHRDIDDLVQGAIRTSPIWNYAGHVGHYVRTAVMPEYVKQALAQRQKRSMKLLLLDVLSAKALNYWRAYRQGAATIPAAHNTKDFLVSVLATLLTAKLWEVRSSGFVSIEVRLAEGYSVFRRDICSEFVLITTAHTDEPVVYAPRASAWYASHVLDFELLFEQAPPLKRSEVAVNDERPESVAAFFEELGFCLDADNVRDAIREARDQTPPYTETRRS